MTITRPPDDDDQSYRYPPPRKSRRPNLPRELTRNDLFYRFMLSMFVILLTFGAGMTLVILFDDDTVVGSRMVNVFAASFSAFISFGAGYLYGAGARKDDN